MKRKILLISVFVIAALLLLSASHSLGMQAGAVFAVTPTLFTDVTTASSFKQGDMIFFDIKTNDQAVTSVKVMIKDPTGTYWWGTPDLAITWPVVFDAEGHGYTPFALQLAYGLNNMHLTLPANAPPGPWTWTITLPSAATTLPLIRSGIFEVTSSAPTPTPTPTPSTPYTIVATATSFKGGDMIFFDIKTNDQAVTSVKVMIKDPTGTYWWGTPDLAITWPVVFDAEGHGYTPFALQLAYGLDNMNLILPANAPVGAWTWTITLPSAATTLPLIRSGIFEVTSSAPTPTPTPTSTATSTPTSSPTLPPTPTPTLTPTATPQPTSSLPTVYLVAIIVIAVVIAIVIAVFVLKKRSHTQPPPPPPKLNSPGRTL